MGAWGPGCPGARGGGGTCQAGWPGLPFPIGSLGLPIVGPYIYIVTHNTGSIFI